MRFRFPEVETRVTKLAAIAVLAFLFFAPAAAVAQRSYLIQPPDVAAASGPRPSCSDSNRSRVWIAQSSSGTADVYQVCLKAADGLYSWVSFGDSLPASSVTPGTFDGSYTFDATGCTANCLVFDTTGDGGNDGSIVFNADGNESVVFTNGACFNSTIRIGFNSTIQVNSNGSLRFNHSQSDLFLMIADNGANNNDSVSFRNPTASVTAARPVLTTESNFSFRTGDTDGQTFTLPNDPTLAGLYWRLIVTQTQASNSMSIAPPAGETLRDGTSNCSTLTATEIGAVVVIEVTATGNGGHFTVVDKLGTWTCNP